MVKDLKKDVEKGHVKYENSQEKSTHIEATHETLVSELKDELCRATCDSPEEHYLEVDDTQKQTEEEFEMEDTEEFHEGRENCVQVKEIAEEMKNKARDSEEDAERKVDLEREEQIELEDSARESDWENSEDENECERRCLLSTVLDGQCCV